HSRASYTSNAESASPSVNFAAVLRNTSPPVSLASKNPDSRGSVPEEISPTHPTAASLKVQLEPCTVLEHEPTPSSSYSYTSLTPFSSAATKPSLLLKNKRPLSDR